MRWRDAVHFHDNGGKLDWLSILLALPAEGKDLTYQVLGSLPGLYNLNQVLMFFASGRKIGKGEFCETQDGNQEVVKIVGNTPG